MTEALAEAGNLRTFGVDLAVDFHEQQDGFNAAPGVLRAEHVLIGEVLDGVAEFFEGVSRHWSNAAADCRGAGHSPGMSELRDGSGHA